MANKEKQEKQEQEMEQWNDVKDNKGKATTVIIILILVIIIGLLGGFIFMKKDVLFDKKEKVNEHSEKATKEVKETKDDTEEIKDIDLTKSLNTTGYNYSNLTDKDQDLGITININDDKRSVKVSYDTKALSSISSVTQSTFAKDQGYSNEIKGFNNNIKSTFISGMGQDITGTVLFFITEDKSLQFVKLFNQETDSKGNTYHTTYWAYGDDKVKIQNVDDVDGIVKLYGANASAPQSTGYYTTLAAKADGSFYDLSQIIK